MASHRDAVGRYLSRLGYRSRPGPTAGTLIALQRRHLDLIPYDNLAAALGRPDPADPALALERLGAGGNGGYCFQQNGAFELVLRDLGFTVRRRFGHVDGDGLPDLNHLVLAVTIGGRLWWPDLGLGDGLRDPAEVADGELRQGPFRYEITDADPAAGTWTFRHDPSVGSFTRLDVRAHAPSDAEIGVSHRYLSTPPEGRFTRTLVVARLFETGTEVLRGIRHRRDGHGPFTRDLESYADWRDALAALHVSAAGATEEELRGLHRRMLARHEEHEEHGERDAREERPGTGLDPHAA